MQPDVPGQLERRTFAFQPELSDFDRVIVERELNRAVVRRRIVEQLELQPLDIRFDEEMIDIR